MTDENENEWGKIELNQAPEDLEIETEETVEVDLQPEVEIEQEEVVEASEEKEPELEGIETKGAEKRIRQLIKQRKDRDEELLKAKEELVALRQQMSEVGKIRYDYDGALAEAKEGEVNSKLENARNKFKEAYDAGNKDGVLSAQEELAEAKTELRLIDQKKQWIEQQKTQYQEEEEKRQKHYDAAPPEIDPLAKDWAETNDWFGKDRTATAVALSIDAELKEQGEDPSDPSFYEKVNARLKEELPSKFGDNEVSEKATPKKPKQVVAGRSHSPVSRNKVKLTKEDVRLAEKWSIPLERYAAEKAKADRSDGDYTTVV